MITAPAPGCSRSEDSDEPTVSRLSPSQPFVCPPVRLEAASAPAFTFKFPRLICLNPGVWGVGRGAASAALMGAQNKNRNPQTAEGKI